MINMFVFPKLYVLCNSDQSTNQVFNETWKANYKIYMKAQRPKYIKDAPEKV